MQYMHVLRGKEEEVGNQMGLRKFYDGKDRSGKPRLSDWQEVTKSLRKLIWGWKYIMEKSDNPFHPELGHCPTSTSQQKLCGSIQL